MPMIIDNSDNKIELDKLIVKYEITTDEMVKIEYLKNIINRYYSK